MNKEYVTVEKEIVKKLVNGISNAETCLISAKYHLDEMKESKVEANDLDELLNKYCELKAEIKEKEEMIDMYEKKIQEQSNEIMLFRNKGNSVYINDIGFSLESLGDRIRLKVFKKGSGYFNTILVINEEKEIIRIGAINPRLGFKLDKEEKVVID